MVIFKNSKWLNSLIFTHRLDRNRYYLSRSEWTWEQWQWRGTPHSPKLWDWGLTIRWSRSRDQEIYFFTFWRHIPHADTYTWLVTEHARTQDFPMVTTTHSGGYIDMLSPANIPFRYYDNTLVYCKSTNLKTNIHSRGESKFYHLSICLFSYGTTSIQFAMSPPTHTHTCSQQSNILSANMSFTHTRSSEI